jgi:cell division protein FtsL
MTWQPRQPKWDWRRFLTSEEAKVLREADAAKERWRKLNAERATITNRAIQRAKYHAQNAR